MKKTILAATAAIMMSCSATGELLKDQSFCITELNGTEYVSMGDEPALILFHEGRLNANLGGNSISADYKEGRNGSITLNHALSTRMLVPEEFRETEFIDALGHVTGFTLDEDVITLVGEDGSVLVRGRRL